MRTEPLRGLDTLRAALDPLAETDPIAELEQIAKTFVAKRKTADTERVWIADLQTDPEYQRPIDRSTITSMVEHLKAGGTLKPPKVNRRPDGSLWITDGQHRTAARAICGEIAVDAIVTDKPQHREQEDCEILTKVSERQDGLVVEALRGAGAHDEGKRLVLTLGPGRRVEYMPHAEWVGRAECGSLRVEAPDALRVAKALDLLPQHGRVTLDAVDG